MTAFLRIYVFSPLEMRFSARSTFFRFVHCGAAVSSCEIASSSGIHESSREVSRFPLIQSGWVLLVKNVACADCYEWLGQRMPPFMNIATTSKLRTSVMVSLVQGGKQKMRYSTIFLLCSCLHFSILKSSAHHITVFA